MPYASTDAHPWECMTAGVTAKPHPALAAARCLAWMATGSASLNSCTRQKSACDLPRYSTPAPEQLGLQESKAHQRAPFAVQIVLSIHELRHIKQVLSFSAMALTTFGSSPASPGASCFPNTENGVSKRDSPLELLSALQILTPPGRHVTQGLEIGRPLRQDSTFLERKTHFCDPGSIPARKRRNEKRSPVWLRQSWKH